MDSMPRREGAADDDVTSELQAWNNDIERCAGRAAHGDEAKASDFAQDARIIVLKAVRKVGPLAEPFARTLISNSVKSSLRAATRGLALIAPPVEDPDESLDPDLLHAPDPKESEEIQQVVGSWVTTLPPPFPELYQHLYVEGCSQRDAARLMNVSQPRVSQLHARLLARGREEMECLSP